MAIDECVKRIVKSLPDVSFDIERSSDSVELLLPAKSAAEYLFYILVSDDELFLSVGDADMRIQNDLDEANVEFVIEVCRSVLSHGYSARRLVTDDGKKVGSTVELQVGEDVHEFVSKPLFPSLYRAENIDMPPWHGA